MNMYAICHKTRHYRDDDNYSCEREDPSDCYVAREGESKEDFIARLIREHLDPIPQDYSSDRYTTFHIDWLFEGVIIAENIDITQHKEYIERESLAKQRQAEEEARKLVARKESIRNQIANLQKELGEV